MGTTRPGSSCSTAADALARFVAPAVAEGRRARSANEAVVGVRSLLRFLFQQELIPPLANAVPWLARGRTSSLPRTLACGRAGLLASCDRDTLVGVRTMRW